MKYEDVYTLKCKSCGQEITITFGVRDTEIEPSRVFGTCMNHIDGSFCGGDMILKSEPIKKVFE